MHQLAYHQSLAQTNWQPCNNKPTLGKGTHLWRICLDTPEQLHQLLSAEEKARIARFHFSHDRARHTVARGRLRQILGNYLCVAPEKLAFGYAEKGKPFLKDYPDLQFNLSHAGKWGLLGVCRNREIGVDVEPVDRSFAVADLVNRFFSPVEIPVILNQPEKEQHSAFFRAWTRKEAIIKAHGDGLSLPLSQFGVSIKLQEEVRLLHLDWSPQQCGEWQLTSFTLAPEVPGAVAMRGELGEVRFWDAP